MKQFITLRQMYPSFYVNLEDVLCFYYRIFDLPLALYAATYSTLKEKKTNNQKTPKTLQKTTTKTPDNKVLDRKSVV